MQTEDITSNYIDGEWVRGERTVTDLNPSDLDDVVGLYALATPSQVEAAIAAARRAFATWSCMIPRERGAMLDRISTEFLARKDDLGRLLSREEDKTLPEGIGEATRAGQIFRFFAAEAVRAGGEPLDSVRPSVTVEITREPVGVVGQIAPWNFPLAIPAWKIAPALAYGNCVVFKPAELVPACVWALADIAARTCIPPGVFNLLIRGAELAAAICRSQGHARASSTPPSRRPTCSPEGSAAHIEAMA